MTGSESGEPLVPAERVPTRSVLCTDALPWLVEHAPLAGCSVITSLPDVSGLPGSSLDEWREWFVRAARACLAATPDDGVTIFYQTDIKVDGTWVDKSYLCQRAAEEERAALLWHKIACRKPAGQASFGRPTYSHLLCHSRGVRDRALWPSPDVLPTTGKMTWSQAMGVEACRLACAYVLSHTSSRTIVDPFCGHGTVLAVANQLGLDAVGVEIGKKRARKARNLQSADL
jgi:DNA methylase